MRRRWPAAQARLKSEPYAAAEDHDVKNGNDRGDGDPGDAAGYPGCGVYRVFGRAGKEARRSKEAESGEEAAGGARVENFDGAVWIKHGAKTGDYAAREIGHGGEAADAGRRRKLIGGDKPVQIGSN